MCRTSRVSSYDWFDKGCAGSGYDGRLSGRVSVYVSALCRVQQETRSMHAITIAVCTGVFKLSWSRIAIMIVYISHVASA